MPIISFISLVACTLWFGGTYLYFIWYLRKNTEYEFTTMKLISHFVGNVKNVYKFYNVFFYFIWKTTINKIFLAQEQITNLCYLGPNAHSCRA